MVVITSEGNITNIKTSDLEINIKGSYEIKLENKTPAAETTDVEILLDNKKII